VVPAPSLRELPDLGGGIEERQLRGGSARVTSLERTLVDLFDCPDRGGGGEEVWRSLSRVTSLDLEAVVAYAKRLSSAVVCARVGFFLESRRPTLGFDYSFLTRLKALAPNGPRYFDPSRAPGKLVRGWNLVVPPSLMEIAGLPAT
jgi:predicted transcriptional regulator of viral defense system